MSERSTGSPTTGSPTTEPRTAELGTAAPGGPPRRASQSLAARRLTNGASPVRPAGGRVGSDLPELQSVPVGLLVLAEWVGGPVARTLRRLVGGLLAGEPLADHPQRRRLSPRLRKVLDLGEAHNVLLPVLRTEIECQTAGSRLRSILTRGLVYPMATLGVALVILGVEQRALSNGSLYSLVDDFGIERGRLGNAVTSLLALWPVSLVAGTLALTLVLWGLAAPAIPGLADLHRRLLARLPVIGKAQRMRGNAEVLAFAAPLLRCRMPADRAFALAAELGQTPGAAQLGSHLADGIRAGASVPEAMAASGLRSWTLHENPSPDQLARELEDRALDFQARAWAVTETLMLWLVPLLVTAAASAILMIGVFICAPFGDVIRLLNSLT